MRHVYEELVSKFRVSEYAVAVLTISQVLLHPPETRSERIVSLIDIYEGSDFVQPRLRSYLKSQLES